MQSNTKQYYPSFYTFYESYFFPGQTPVPPRSGTWILDLSHDPIWAIWLAEVRKFHQHHDRINHWGLIRKLGIIFSDNGVSPDRCQAIIRTNAEILLIGPLGTNLSEILIEIHTFSYKKIHLKMSYGKWPPFCLGLNVLICFFTVWRKDDVSVSILSSYLLAISCTLQTKMLFPW